MRYRELLRHPKWQRRRLEIMERAEFRCEFCGNDKMELHVHHKRYETGRAPWDYPDDDLICLCGSCHFEEHEDDLPRATRTDDLLHKAERWGLNYEEKAELSALFKADPHPSEAVQ